MQPNPEIQCEKERKEEKKEKEENEEEEEEENRERWSRPSVKDKKKEKKKKTTVLERATGLTVVPQCVCIYKNAIITLFP